jgi:hypothetical protein
MVEEWLSLVVDTDAEREDEDGSCAGRGLLCRLNGIWEVTLTIWLLEIYHVFSSELCVGWCLATHPFFERTIESRRCSSL